MKKGARDHVGGEDVDARLIAAGIGLTLLTSFLFTINDTIAKWTLSSLSLGQLLLIRSGVGLVVLAPMIARTPPRTFVAAHQPLLQVVRAALSTGEMALFFIAVSFLPLADVITIYLAAPIIVTIMAALFLGEHVGWRRWLAVAIGFVGVVLAIGPSAAVATGPALIALVGSFGFALFIIATRHLRSAPDTVLVTWQFVAATGLGLVLSIFDWRPTSWESVLPVAVMGLIAVVAQALSSRSLKLAPASALAPFQYTVIVWAIGFGWVVFGDVPGPMTLAGAALIVAAGLFIFFRERRVEPDKADEPPPLTEV